LLSAAALAVLGLGYTVLFAEVGALLALATPGGWEVWRVAAAGAMLGAIAAIIVIHTALTD